MESGSESVLYIQVVISDEQRVVHWRHQNGKGVCEKIDPRVACRHVIARACDLCRWHSAGEIKLRFSGACLVAAEID